MLHALDVEKPDREVVTILTRRLTHEGFDVK